MIDIFKLKSITLSYHEKTRTFVQNMKKFQNLFTYNTLKPEARLNYI